VATVLDKELKRQISVDSLDYTVALNPDGIRLTGKRKTEPSPAGTHRPAQKKRSRE